MVCISYSRLNFKLAVNTVLCTISIVQKVVMYKWLFPFGSEFSSTKIFLAFLLRVGHVLHGNVEINDLYSHFHSDNDKCKQRYLTRKDCESVTYFRIPFIG